MDIVGNLELIWASLPLLLSGTLITVKLAFYFLAVGLSVGITVALIQLYGNAPSRFSALLFEQVFRGLPALLLLLLFYFGLSELGFSSTLSAVLALGLRSGAFQSQVFRGAIQSVEAGQIAAARAIGMTRLQSICYIILPQALRLAIPAWTNEAANIVKDTSFVFVVGLIDLMRQGRYIIARTFGNSLLIYFVIALIYFVIIYSLSISLRVAERRLAIPGNETD